MKICPAKLMIFFILWNPRKLFNIWYLFVIYVGRLIHIFCRLSNKSLFDTFKHTFKIWLESLQSNYRYIFIGALMRYLYWYGYMFKKNLHVFYKLPLVAVFMCSGGRLDITMSSNRYRNSHYEERKYPGCLIFKMESHRPGRTVFVLKQGPVSLLTWMGQGLHLTVCILILFQET